MNSVAIQTFDSSDNNFKSLPLQFWKMIYNVVNLPFLILLSQALKTGTALATLATNDEKFLIG